jgi:hypothetical protein
LEIFDLILSGTKRGKGSSNIVVLFAARSDTNVVWVCGSRSLPQYSLATTL